MQGADAGEQPNRIQVVVRVRPVLPHELADDVAVTCSSDTRKLQVLLPDRLAGGTSVLPGATRSGARSYEFDACLSGRTTQEELYDTCGLQELVEAALDGYCVTVFAFGQTGSGKTHSIIGPRLSRGGGGGAVTGGTARPGGDDFVAVPSSASSSRSNPPSGISVDPEDGILTRCIAAAYRSIEARAGTAEFSVTASVVELYNESVTDLLALDKTKQLQIRKDARDGFAVTGLTQVACPNDVAAVRYMVRALQYRHTRGHKLNEYSSRSHCLMTFVFASKEAGPGGQMGAKGGIRRYGKLALVDLAGSERLKDTGNTEKGAVRETGAINKSLFTLGQVLASLSARSTGSGSTFVPFRDSKLTQLLWDGLRGSGRCLMLACLGPMRSAAEESLNTLHFATMATRIKAEPVVLLDPQDQLVLDLRKVIMQLREENKQLAGALQQLSSGVDPNAVLSNLPEGLRTQAAAGSGSTGSGAWSPEGSSSPGTPLRPQHLQPLAPPPASGAPRRSYDAGGGYGAPSMGATSPGGGAGHRYSAPSPSQPPPPQLQRIDSGGLRTSYGSSVGGYGSSGGQPQGQYQQGQSVAGPTYAPVSSRAARSKHQGSGAHRKPSPLHSMYGVSPAGSPHSPGRHGRKASGGPGKGASTRDGGGNRSRSEGQAGGGGGGGRPAYLTEDPGALLFGHSNALRPQQPPPGSGGSVTVLPALGRGRGVAERPAPAPPAAFTDFPELAAMEAEFQNLMVNGGAGAAVACAAKRGSATGVGGVAGGAEAEPDDSGAHKPDVRALKWADRNSWFGTDYDMTAFAYMIHDQLVDFEHIDPATDAYYMEIERRVAEKFPDRWSRIMRDQPPGGIRRSAPSPGHLQPAAPPQVPSYGAALRVNVKEPLFRGPNGSSAPDSNNDVAASLAAQAAAARSRQQPSAAAYENGSYEYGELQLGSVGTNQLVAPPYGSQGSEPNTPPLSGVNPFNIGALHAMAPPKASRFTQGPGGGNGMVLAPAGAEALGRGAAADMASDPNAAERIQREYARQRAMVVEELRQAKEDAEAERQRILNRIQRAAGGSKWR